MNESLKNFSNQRKGFFLRKFLALLEEVLEVSFIAELGDDVAIVGRTEDVVAFEDVGVI